MFQPISKHNFIGLQVNINHILLNYLYKVSSMELVQEIHQLLMDREDTCHRTCFSLQLNGNSLDNFAELKTVEGRELSKYSIIFLYHPKKRNRCMYFRQIRVQPLFIRFARWICHKSSRGAVYSKRGTYSRSARKGPPKIS